MESPSALVVPSIPPPAAWLDPEALHPALWRAHQLGRSDRAGLPTGFAALDAELPGAGWPVGALTELLLPHPGVGELRLLAPALAAVMRGEGSGPGVSPGASRSVMLFDPPAEPCAWALAALGLDVRQWLLVRSRAGRRCAARGAPGADMSKRRAVPSFDAPPRGANAARGVPGADMLWALEQALTSGHVGAILAWLPARLRADTLRRLQLAAQSHPGPVFLFREVDARLKPSAAPLRLQLAVGAPDRLLLRLLKRRGAPRAAPLTLALPAVLSATAQARAQRAAPGLPQRAAASALA